MQTVSTPQPTTLRKWRQDAGLSLGQLAEAAHVDKGHLSRVERGLSSFGSSALARVLRQLGQGYLADVLEEMRRPA